MTLLKIDITKEKLLQKETENSKRMMEESLKTADSVIPKEIMQNESEETILIKEKHKELMKKLDELKSEYNVLKRNKNDKAAETRNKIMKNKNKVNL